MDDAHCMVHSACYTDTGLDVGVAFARQLVGVGDIRRAQMYGTLHPEQMYIVWVMLRTHFGGVLTLRVWVVKFIPQQNSLSA